MEEGPQQVGIVTPEKGSRDGHSETKKTEAEMRAQRTARERHAQTPRHCSSEVGSMTLFH